eukprot:scaffold258842_cov24-Tisochrysis_lutea.AAC.1
MLAPPALHTACQEGQTRYVRELLALGADPDALDDAGETALFYACEYGHAGCAALLLAHDGGGEEHAPIALRAACRRGHLACAELLLPLVAPRHHDVALRKAAENGAVHVVDHLLRRLLAVEPDAARGLLPSALFSACLYGSDACVRLLLQHCEPGHRELITACEDGYTLCAEALLAHGAARSELNGDEGALEVACAAEK